MVIINAEKAKHKTMLTKYFYTSVSNLMVLFVSSNPNIATVCKLKLQSYRTQFVKKLNFKVIVQDLGNLFKTGDYIED